jgi:hypothetical protein
MSAQPHDAKANSAASGGCFLVLGQRVMPPIPGQHIIQKSDGNTGGFFQGAQIERCLRCKWGHDKGRQVETAQTAIPMRFQRFFTAGVGTDEGVSDLLIPHQMATPNS